MNDSGTAQGLRQRLGVWLERPFSHKVASIARHLWFTFLIDFLLAHLFSLARRADNRAFRRARLHALKRVSEFALSAINREYYVVITSDEQISTSIYARGSFDFEKVRKAVSILGDGFKLDTLIDVGANIGTICIPAVKRGIARAAVAIEPEPRNFRVLTANIWLNGLADRIQTHNIAFGSESHRVLAFELSPDNSGDHRIRVSSVSGAYNEAARTIIEVKSERFDDIITQVDSTSQLIWIDTQGYEGFVLEGAADAISQRVPVVIEFWPYGMRRADSYGSVKRAMMNYQVFFDLSSQVSVPVRISESSIDQLYKSLGEYQSYTDLLLR
jgi:FkbM family methyltransferase